MRILFIDNYDSFTYNVVELLRQFEDVELSLVTNDQLSDVQITDYDRLIISPGPDLPSRSGQLPIFITENMLRIPTLGICLGHQAIAEYFGGTLMQYHSPRHGERCKLSILDQKGLFTGLPKQFQVGLYHSWYVNSTDLPGELFITAQSEEGIIMALQHKTLPIYSVQFHPESYMSEYGMEILQNFIQCA